MYCHLKIKCLCYVYSLYTMPTNSPNQIVYYRFKALSDKFLIWGFVNLKIISDIVIICVCAHIQV